MKPHQREGAAEPARSPDTRSDPDLAYPRGSHSAEASELPGGRGGKVRASPALRAGTRVQVTCKPLEGPAELLGDIDMVDDPRVHG